MLAARRSNRRLWVGILLVLFGLVSNSRLIAFLASPDHRIDHPIYKVTILLFQVLFLAAGATLLILRNDPARLRSAGIKAGVVCASVLLFGAGLEILLRIRPAGTPYALRLYAERSSGKLEVKPDLNLTARVGRTKIPVVTNSRGMRWREVSPANHSARKRIAFLGDSLTFGEWADDLEHCFVSVFDSLVDERTWEVLNFGVPSYGQLEEKLQLVEDVLPFHPDVVFLMLFNGNDFVDTYLGLERYRVVDGIAVLDTMNLKRRVPSAQLQLGPGTSSHAGSRFADRVFDASRVLRTLEQLYWRYSEPKRQRAFAPSEAFTAFTFWSRTQPPAVAAAAFDSTLHALDEIWTSCQNNGIRLVIATIPFAEQVYASQPEGDGYSISLPQQHVLEFARERDIAYLDLLPALRSAAQQTGARLYVPGDPHLNTAGHRITGETLAAFFRSLTDAGL